MRLSTKEATTRMAKTVITTFRVRSRLRWPRLSWVCLRLAIGADHTMAPEGESSQPLQNDHGPLYWRPRGQVVGQEVP